MIATVLDKIQGKTAVWKIDHFVGTNCGLETRWSIVTLKSSGGCKWTK